MTERVGHNPDCAGYEWTVGEVYGYKTFNRDKLGRLVSPSAHHVWTPGENVSTFAKDERHGFYAYTSGSQWPEGSVYGIIKGYGRTTEGTRGFQCEKAEIVALVEPKPVRRTWIRDVIAKLLVSWKSRDLFDLAAIGMMLGALIEIFLLCVIGANALSPWLFFTCAVPPIVWEGLRRHTKIFSGTYGNQSRHRAEEYLAVDGPPTLRTLYPNVKFYDSLEKLKRDEQVAGIECKLTPDSPEFWTVEV